ncbi:MAG: OB-fold domain-containing protein [Actinomycetota bacterium]|nr:OB-fold domain-containing protein [Actinomycetota bacterium]
MTVPQGWKVEADRRSAPYFEAAGAGRLLVRRCRDCGAWFPPHVDRCGRGHETEWAEASGRGVLISWAVDHSKPLAPELTDASGERTVTALVELDEGVWLHVAVPSVDPSALAVGERMKVEFVRPGGGDAVAVFLPEDDHWL